MRIFDRVRVWLGLGVSSHRFAAGPMPIDRMWREMLHGSATITRDEAKRVPGVLKARNLLCSIATLPLVERGPGNTVVRAPLLEQIDPNVANVVTLSLTVEDLLFDAVSWWRVLERGSDRYPVKARRLAPGSVSLDPPATWRPATPAGLPAGTKVVFIDGEEVSAADVIRFDSPNPALCQFAGKTLRTAVRYMEAADMYAANPQPTEHFTPSDGAEEKSDEEIADAIKDWRAARRAGSTAYVPRWLAYNPGAAPTAADMKLPELKQQAALETALCVGLDPEALGVSTTSRTYANAQDWRRDRINDVLAAYMLAITQRLSMGDVCRRGYGRTFDLDDYMRADPVTRWTVYTQAVAMGAMDVAQVQQEEGLPVTGGAPVAPAIGLPPTTPATPAGDDELAARRGRAAAGFTADRTADGSRTFGFASRRFEVDVAARSIAGLAVPYDEVAMNGGQRYRFAQGSLEWPEELTRVKLLRDHDPREALGVALELTDGAPGLHSRFRVGTGPERDQALADAHDQIVDGLSIGVDFDDETDTVDDPENPGVRLVQRATLNEISLTAMPAFTGARVSAVTASRTGEGSDMFNRAGAAAPPAAPAPAPAAAPAAPAAPAAAHGFSADELTRLRALLAGEPATPAPAAGPAVLDPAGPAQAGTATVREPLPYRFASRRRRIFAPGQQHDFSTDVVAMLRSGDFEGRDPAGRRVLAALADEFHAFTVETGDINEANPTVQRPDLYVDERDYRYPLWESVNKGTPPNGVQPFTFPKFNSASGLVGDHTEGVEPTTGNFTTTGQTVTPSALSGKASITREVYDMGGNPAVSTLIYNQMVKGYREGLESATATFLNTLTAATDIALGVAVVDDALADAWDQAIAGLQFIRGYDFTMFAVEQVLFKAFVAAEDSTGRRLFPIINPMNANGQAERRFMRLDLSGVTAVPSWALASTPGALNNSWLFDPSTVHGWATAPQRLEFAGTAGDGSYAPVAFIDIAIWGYKAFANSDIGGVRQVTYDSVT